MRIGLVHTATPKNTKGYQSAKMYIPNDTLMGSTTKTPRNTNKKKVERYSHNYTHVLTNCLNELTNPVIHL